MNTIFWNKINTMKKIISCIALTLMLLPVEFKAQDSIVKGLIVEPYYISNWKDTLDSYATDPSLDSTGVGRLDSGTTTYRIYVQLAPGYKLEKVYGDKNHALKITSTAHFFNHLTNGKGIGADISANPINIKNRATFALDSWLTIRQASSAYAGILKTEDPDSSIIGGNKSKGLLANNAAGAGIPLTQKDGLMAFANPTSLVGSGDLSKTNIDSTLFGSVIATKQFISNDAELIFPGGALGTLASNKILVAQFTTKGKLSFELNIEVVDSAMGGKLHKFVADDKVLLSDEKLSPYLKYPPPCGCTDKNYLEYKSSAACSEPGACKTLKIFGCTDPDACNYDPNANSYLAGFCCYPGSCQNRDISLVCPTLSINEKEKANFFKLYPNPTQDQLSIQFIKADLQNVSYEIIDAYGRLTASEKISTANANSIQPISVIDLANGIYLLRIMTSEGAATRTFIKN